MAPEALAKIRSDPAVLATTIEYATLRAGDPTAHDVMFVRCLPDRIETPAAAPDADLASYCTGRAGMYDDLAVYVDGPVDAMFDIDRVTSWLAWLDEGDEPVTTTFEGDPSTGVTRRLVHQTGETTVVVPCEMDWRYEDVSLSAAERFEDGRYHDPAGDPMPTRVETDIAQLERLVAASDMATEDREYVIEITEDGLGLDAIGDGGVSVSAALPATVSGPPATTTVGPELADVVSGLEGPVSLQTGPDQPVAIVQDYEAFTNRFVVAPA